MKVFSLESFPPFIIMACIRKVIHGMGNIGGPNFDSNQDYLWLKASLIYIHLLFQKRNVTKTGTKAAI